MSLESSAPAGTYQFGDSDLAAERLRLLAAAFEPSSREFLAKLTAADPRDVVDLGCGPGYTTRLLAEVFPRARVVGIDSSAHFVALARQAAMARISYQVADVSHCLPAGPCDLLYCRYLLTHIPQPVRAIEAWSRQLRPGGLLVIEENEWIHTDQPVFARYLGIAAALLADAGQRLYVGAELAKIDGWPTLEKHASEVVPIVVSDRATAGMFLLNLATWRQRPFIVNSYSGDELDRLRSELEVVAAGDPQKSSITFGRRRLVLLRPRA
jgi:SAM-dependent methyltransferase